MFASLKSRLAGSGAEPDKPDSSRGYKQGNMAPVYAAVWEQFKTEFPEAKGKHLKHEVVVHNAGGSTQSHLPYLKIYDPLDTTWEAPQRWILRLQLKIVSCCTSDRKRRAEKDKTATSIFCSSTRLKLGTTEGMSHFSPEDMEKFMNHSIASSRRFSAPFSMSAPPSIDMADQSFHQLNSHGPMKGVYEKAWKTFKLQVYEVERDSWRMIAYNPATEVLLNGKPLHKTEVHFYNPGNPSSRAPEFWTGEFFDHVSYHATEDLNKKDSCLKYANSIFCSDASMRLDDPTKMSEDDLRTVAETVASGASISTA